MRKQLAALIAVAAMPMVPAISAPANAQAWTDPPRPSQSALRVHHLNSGDWKAPLITHASRKACREREAALLQKLAAQQTEDGTQSATESKRPFKSRCG